MNIIEFYKQIISFKIFQIPNLILGIFIYFNENIYLKIKINV